MIKTAAVFAIAIAAAASAGLGLSRVMQSRTRQKGALVPVKMQVVHVKVDQAP